MDAEPSGIGHTSFIGPRDYLSARASGSGISR